MLGRGWVTSPHPAAIPIRCLQFTPGVNLKPEKQDATLTSKRSWVGAGCVGWEIKERGATTQKGRENKNWGGLGNCSCVQAWGLMCHLFQTVVTEQCKRLCPSSSQFGKSRGKQIWKKD